MMRLAKKRRIENKTDYNKRMKLLKSSKARIVFRKTNKYIIAQYISSQEAQDKIEIGLDSRELLSVGWPKEFAGSLKSITAAYLTGYLIAKKIIKAKKETPIVDLGMIRIIHKTKMFAFIKGMIDAGLKIKCEKEHFPEEDRIKGKNLKEDFSKNFTKIKENIDKQ